MKIKNFNFLLLLLTFYFYLLPYPLYAAVDIGGQFGFGYVRSFGEGFSLLVGPAFSVATAAVVFYFLIGAFKYLSSGGSKEEVASAQQMITHAIIGFALLMFLFLILQFLLARLFGITEFQVIRTF